MRSRAATALVAALAMLVGLCEPAFAARSREHAPLGMVPMSPDGSGDPLASIAQARALGADPLLWYWSWRDLRSRGPDFIMPALTKDGRSVVNFAIASTTVQGDFPAPWTSFTQDGFAEAFAVDAGAFVAKWKPTYACLGNEAGTYLAKHPSEIDAYERVLRRFREAVRANSPHTLVCVTLSFRDSTKDGHALAKRLRASSDALVWTVYGYRDPGFRFVEVQEGIDWLDRVERESPKPYAISETGWNSATELGSSEAMQADFVRRLRARESSSQFTTLFYLRDGRDCSARARAFLTPDMLSLPPDRLDEAMKPFRRFLCDFGVSRSDGSAKPAAAELKP